MNLIEHTQRPTTAMPSLGQGNLSIAGRPTIRSPVMPTNGRSIQQGPGLVLKRVTIRSLPDEVLLEVFHFCRVDSGPSEDLWEWEEAWQLLVHVCQSWRRVVFASPRSLDLRLYCGGKEPVRKMLNVWPALPLDINFFDNEWERDHPDWQDRWDNVIAAMDRRDRVRHIALHHISSSLLVQVSTKMQESCPALTKLCLCCEPDPRHAAELPDTFLNGSAPRLQRLILERISFPKLRRFLLSTRNLTFLRLWEIPNVAYISPEEMATSLSALPKLKFLDIKFASPLPKRKTRLLPPKTRSVLSALTTLQFKGISEYLEALAAQIDAPILEQFVPDFFNQLVFDITQISRLVGNLRIPRPSGLSLCFSQNDETSVCFSWSPKGSHGNPSLNMAVLGQGLDWQVFSVAQICDQILPLCSSVEWLNVRYGKRWCIEPPPKLEMQPEDIDRRLWLELFHSFISVKRLEISGELEPFIAAALQGPTEESATGIFPTLDSLSVVGNASDKAEQQGIESFITSRQHSDHPVSFHRLDHWTEPGLGWLF